MRWRPGWFAPVYAGNANQKPKSKKLLTIKITKSAFYALHDIARLVPNVN